MSVRSLETVAQNFPIAGSFTISRGSRTSVDVVLATVTDGEATGRGECTPYPRYGESVEGVKETILSQRHAIADGMTRQELQLALPAGAARNALDCALWDLEAKQSSRRVWDLAGCGPCGPLTTAFTISLGSPGEMATAAAASNRPLLKLKLGGDGDAERIQAIRAAVPDTKLIVDANEAWSPDLLPDLMLVCAEHNVALVEQPLPAGNDDLLAEIERPVPVCADESAHDRSGLETLIGKYDAINIKIDKTGGLTEALLLAQAATAAGLGIMVGCMLASSLSMAPAMVVAQRADTVDLDGPLLLARDRTPAIRYDGSLMYPPEAALWG